MFKKLVYVYQIVIMEHGYSLDETDEDGETCLYSASMIGHLEIVQYLVEKVLIIEAKEEDQRTSLLIASSFGQTEVVKYLVSKRSNKTPKTKIVKNHMMWHMIGLMIYHKDVLLGNFINESKQLTQKI